MRWQFLEGWTALLKIRIVLGDNELELEGIQFPEAFQVITDWFTIVNTDSHITQLQIDRLAAKLQTATNQLDEGVQAATPAA